MNGTPFGLRVHHRRAGRVDRTAEHLRQELARIRLREPVELEAAHDAHAPHVGDQVHGLGHDRELLGPDREHQEDRARAVGTDHVAQQAEAVLVRPLEVVDQDGERPFGGQGAERDGAQVERAEQTAVGRERGESRIVLTRHRVQAAARARPRSSRPSAARAASGEPRIERATRNGPRSSSSAVTAIAVKPSAVARSAAATQQPRLADPRLALDREADEPPAARRGELLRDRLELRRPADDVAGRPMDVERHRRERQRSVVVRDHLVSGGRGCEGSPDSAQRSHPAHPDASSP